MSKVALFAIDTTIEDTIRKAVEEVCDFQALVDGKRTLIKPCIGIGDTNPEVTKAVALLVREAGGQPIIGESAFANPPERMQEKFEQLGYTQFCQEHEIPLINFNADEPIEVDIGGRALKKAIVAKSALECDVIINVPYVHNHGKTWSSLGIKNMKGILPMREKFRTHRAGLDQAIVDLNRHIRPALVVLDGTIAFDYYGGQVKYRMNLIGASTDIVAIDAVGTILMGYDLELARYLVLAHEQGLGLMEGYEVVGEDPTKHAVRMVDPTTQLLNIKREKFQLRIVEGTFACSGCLSTVVDLFTLTLPTELEDWDKDVTAYIGTEPEFDTPLPECFLIVGNCASKAAKDAGLTDHYVGGCPPKMPELQSLLLKLYGPAD